jgi:hypothetical protein
MVVMAVQQENMTGSKGITLCLLASLPSEEVAGLHATIVVATATPVVAVVRLEAYLSVVEDRALYRRVMMVVLVWLISQAQAEAAGRALLGKMRMESMEAMEA